MVLTSEQAAAVLQLTRRTITNMLDRGDLRGVKVGKEWRISRAELVRFVEADEAPKNHIQQASGGFDIDAAPVVVDEGGILVVQAQPLEDLTDFVQRERDQRTAEQIRQVRP
ncbi:MAG: helix-turn-helix domain-containing protein [Caldilinea sp.]|nr:helix-turn-helix domain-containing protein [Caldilinea sp.]